MCMCLAGLNEQQLWHIEPWPHTFAMRRWVLCIWAAKRGALTLWAPIWLLKCVKKVQELVKLWCQVSVTFISVSWFCSVVLPREKVLKHFHLRLRPNQHCSQWGWSWGCWWVLLALWWFVILPWKLFPHTPQTAVVDHLLRNVPQKHSLQFLQVLALLLLPWNGCRFQPLPLFIETKLASEATHCRISFRTAYKHSFFLYALCFEMRNALFWLFGEVDEINLSYSLSALKHWKSLPARRDLGNKLIGSPLRSGGTALILCYRFYFW